MMNIQTFSQTYWYIWFLVILVIVILVLINGGGIFVFRKKRNQFFNQSNKINQQAKIPVINSKYKRISTTSCFIDKSLFTVTTDGRLTHMTKSEELITSTPNSQIGLKENIQSTTSFDQYINKTKKDFQQQALVEHNLIRARYNKPPLKLTEALNIYAQYWADLCARTNIIVPSRLDWRLQFNGQPLGENIISTKITNQFNGIQFTRMIIANDEQSKEVYCLLNEVSTEVGFGFAQSYIQQQWIGVAHYYPYRQLTTVQS